MGWQDPGQQQCDPEADQGPRGGGHLRAVGGHRAASAATEAPIIRGVPGPVAIARIHTSVAT